MTQFYFYMDVVCEKCGNKLLGPNDAYMAGREQVKVPLCPVCLGKAKKEAEAEGYDEGVASAMQDRYDEGYDDGYEAATDYHEAELKKANKEIE